MITILTKKVKIILPSKNCYDNQKIANIYAILNICNWTQAKKASKFIIFFKSLTKTIHTN
jgi:hypothetical protein